MTNSIDREELASQYLEQLEFEPYPVQEDALLSWFTCEQGVLVCAPTGTGKTLIAEAALFEALHSGKRAYYTTPLIALTEQKLQEIRRSAVRWGFSPDQVGLVTGNRRVNPDAPILVVVAEILFNRLLHKDEFQFDDVTAVVMDEFHSFNDPERGIVWEFSLGLLPSSVRLLLLSATVGNSVAFVNWMQRAHQRKVDLVHSDERKVPLTFQWVPDQFLTEHVEQMAKGNDEERFTPALVFCFNRDECWNVAEQLKGKKLLADGQQAALSKELAKHDWSTGAGPKLKQLLQRGVGVHHAGLVPKYKRLVEFLFQRKLLSVTVCTETLAAGINLPARSVVIPNLLKGPPDKKKLIEPSSAHQMFGRAGRPQFDTQGFVFSLPHEDDVKILRWKERFDQIPQDTKDPKLIRAKKALKKKMPTRRANQSYWSESQFEHLRNAPSANLESRGHLPWRLLAYMLQVSPEIDTIRKLIGKRLMQPKQLEGSLKALDRSLTTLWTAGYVELDPKPILPAKQEKKEETESAEKKNESEAPPVNNGLFSDLVAQSEPTKPNSEKPQGQPDKGKEKNFESESREDSEQPVRLKYAYPTEHLERLLMLRGVNPLFGIFAVHQLGIANREERIQVFESVLEMPGTVARYLRVPSHDDLPPGPLAKTRLDVKLLQLGLATPEELGAGGDSDDDDDDYRGRKFYEEERTFVLTLADKLRLLFNHDFPGVYDLRITPVWAAGEILNFAGDFNKFVTSNRLQKQEGVIFRHLLRLILLIGEFLPLCPPDCEPDEWNADLREIREQLIETCRSVDPQSVDLTLESEGQEN